MNKKDVFNKIWGLFALFLVVTLCACSAGKAESTKDVVNGFNQVSSRHLGSVNRSIIEYSDGGLDRYPEYDVALEKASEEEKQAILNENMELFSYDEMDSAGKLFKNGQALDKKLSKHTASKGLYGSIIDDSAEAVAKRIRITPHNIGNNMTGLYAPAGEIVTIILNAKDAKRNMNVHIGQCNARQGSVNIPVNRTYNRMPILKMGLVLNKTVNYVGSPLGGPIYLMNEGGSLEDYEVTIIGAIEMPHYFHNNTTDGAWEKLRKSPAPLFDMEIAPGIRFTLPASLVREKSASEMKAAADFWFKAMSLSNAAAKGSWFSDHPVTMIFDTYVPAGAAVAFVGADFCVLPLSWAAQSINAESIIKSGAWGTIHEFNHHHQGYGAGNGGEVTNNALSALTYMLYTNIATSRTLEGGLGGWNWVSSAYSALNNAKEIEKQNNANTDLSMYVVLQHAFGEKAFIEMASNSTTQAHTSWFKAVTKATGYDMSYYLKDFCNLTIDEAALEEVKAQNLKTFIPVASLYQSGIKNEVTGEIVEMGKPFTISFGASQVIDFSKTLAIPSDYSYEVMEILKPQSGEIEKVSSDVYTYIPNKKNTNKDTFLAKIKLINKNTKEASEVTLQLAFKQNITGVTGGTWENPGYSDIQTALDDKFEETAKKLSAIENVNAKISTKQLNTISKIEGKIVVPQTQDYHFYLKGTGKVILMFGNSATNLEIVAEIENSLSDYDPSVESAHYKIKLKESKPYYFKLYVLSDKPAEASLGWLDSLSVEGSLQNGKDEDNQEIVIVDLPGNYLSNFSSKEFKDEQEEISNQFQPSIIPAGSILMDKKDIQVTKAPALYKNDLDSSKMLDNNPETFLHSATNIVFPVDIAFDLGNATKLNSLIISGRNSNMSRGRIKGLKLYLGETILDMREVFNDELKNQHSVVINFTTTVARYVRLEIYSVWSENYVSISEIDFGNSIQTNLAVDNNNQNIKYKGDWVENYFGTYLNGYNRETSKGSVSYTFNGTSFGIWATTGQNYGVFSVKVDNKDWENINLATSTTKYKQLVFIENDLSDAKHTITIKPKTGLINFDYFGVIQTMPQEVSNSLNVWLIVAVVGGIAIFGGVGFIFIKKKRKK